VKLKCSSLLVAGLVSLTVGVTPSYAVTQSFVTFDPGTNTPANPGDPANTVFSQGPSIYVAVPAPQTIVTTPATFTGGVILGLATFFPAIQFASSPNVYGTADFGNGLSNTLTIGINSPNANITNEVSFALFNGETFAQTYTITAFDINGKTFSQTLNNVAANWQSGFGLVDLIFPNISKVTINATNNGIPVTNTAWDFLIDDVAFNQNITNVIPQTPSTPPPTPQVPYVAPPVVYIPPSIVVDNSINSTVCRGNGNSRKCTITTTVVNNGDNNKNRRGKAQVVKFIDDNTNILTLQTLNAPITNPVPEPENYAMIIVGLGVMGFVARRRRIVS
jgi:hypothetical protein